MSRLSPARPSVFRQQAITGGTETVFTSTNLEPEPKGRFWCLFVFLQIMEHVRTRGGVWKFKNYLEEFYTREVQAKILHVDPEQQDGVNKSYNQANIYIDKRMSQGWHTLVRRG